MSLLSLSLLIQAAQCYEWRSVVPVQDASGKTMGFNFGNGGGMTLPDGTTFNFGGGGGVYFANQQGGDQPNSTPGAPLDQKMQGAIARSIDWSKMNQHKTNGTPGQFPPYPCNEYHIFSGPEECLQACLPEGLNLKSDSSAILTEGSCPDRFKYTSKTTTSFMPFIEDMNVQIKNLASHGDEAKQLAQTLDATKTFLTGFWFASLLNEDEIWSRWSELLGTIPQSLNDDYKKNKPSHCIVQHQAVKGGSSCLQTCNSPLVASLNLMDDGPCTDLDGEIETADTAPLDAIIVTDQIFSSSPVVLRQPNSSPLAKLSYAMHKLSSGIKSNDIDAMQAGLGDATAALNKLAPQIPTQLVHMNVSSQRPAVKRSLRALSETSDYGFCIETMSHPELLSKIVESTVQQGPCPDRTNQISSKFFDQATQVQTWVNEKISESSDQVNHALKTLSDDTDKTRKDVTDEIRKQMSDTNEHMKDFLSKMKSDVNTFLSSIISSVRDFISKMTQSLRSKEASAYMMNDEESSSENKMHHRIFGDGCVQLNVPNHVSEQISAGYGMRYGGCPERLMKVSNWHAGDGTTFDLPVEGTMKMITFTSANKKADDWTLPLSSVKWAAAKTQTLYKDTESADQAAHELYNQTNKELEANSEMLQQLATVPVDQNDWNISLSSIYWPADDKILHKMQKSVATAAPEDDEENKNIVKHDPKKQAIRKELDDKIREARVAAEDQFEEVMKQIHDIKNKIQHEFDTKVAELKATVSLEMQARNLRVAETIDMNELPGSTKDDKTVTINTDKVVDAAQRLYGSVKSAMVNLKDNSVTDAKEFAHDVKSNATKLADHLKEDFTEIKEDTKNQALETYKTLGAKFKDLGDKLQSMELDKKAEGDKMQNIKNDKVKKAYQAMGEHYKQLGEDMMMKFTNSNEKSVPQPAPINWGTQSKQGGVSTGGFDYSKYMGGAQSKQGGASTGGFDYSKYMGGAQSKQGGVSTGGFDYSKYMGGAQSKQGGASTGGFDYSKYMGGAQSKQGGVSTGGFDYSKYMGGAQSKQGGASTGGFDYNHFVDKFKSFNYKDYMGSKDGESFDYSKYINGAARDTGPSSTGFEQIGQSTVNDNDMYCMGVQCPENLPYCNHGVCFAEATYDSNEDLDCRWASCPIEHKCNKQSRKCEPSKEFTVTE